MAAPQNPPARQAADGGRTAAKSSAAVPPAELAQLVALFRAGRHAEMAAAAQRLAERHPDDGQAWKAWGTALLLLRQDALAALQRAATLLPGDAEVLGNLGGVYSARGQLAQAADCHRAALRLQPRQAQALSNLGDVLGRMGQWAEAEDCCRQALALQPRLAAAHVNLGNALKGQRRQAPAAAAYRQALALNPAQAEAQRNLARVLADQGQADDAVAAWRQALALQPRHAASQRELGDLLAGLGRHAEAVAAFEQALALQPAQAELQSNLGVSLLALGRGDAAVAALRGAVQQQPGLALAHSNLGNALGTLGRLHEALASHRQAVALAPELALVQANLGHALKAAGRPEEALAALQQALALAPQQLALHSALLFVQQYLPQPDPARRLADARRFGAAAQAVARPLPPQPAGGPDRCLRVGLLSADLRQHPVGYFIESVLAALAAQGAGRLELFAYASHPEEDALSLRLRASVQAWRAVAGLDDGALAGVIRADAIDVLVDLAGHTLHNRLPVLAWRPAPVQVSWLGYCASTGLDAVDAVLVDPWIAPPGSEAQFGERLLRLPDSFLCFTPPPFDLPVTPLPALALAEGGLRFGGFNHLAKMNDAVVALWARVLHAVPGSTLTLQSAPLQDAEVRREVVARYARHGIAAARLQLHGALPRADYLEALGQVDIALDTFPYPGGTTTAEALWMGVPVLTLPGASPLSRQGLGLLANLGLHDWVAADVDDYLARAVRHAADRPALAALRQGLRPRLLQSALCDAPRFARHLEAALRGLWQEACRRGA